MPDDGRSPCSKLKFSVWPCTVLGSIMLNFVEDWLVGHDDLQLFEGHREEVVVVDTHVPLLADGR